MKFWLSLYTVKLPIYFVYMLQQVEYDPAKLAEWWQRLTNDSKPIRSVMTRQKLVWTQRAKLMVIFLYGALALIIGVELLFILSAFTNPVVIAVAIGVGVLSIPLLLFSDTYILARLAHAFVVAPQNARLVARSKEIFKGHKATKIAVIGSYGKTSMKEILRTVLSEGLEVAATPGNKNVPVSHARFAAKLTGEEDVLLIEFGEGEPGDVAAMSDTINPDFAIITGLAPNHLDQYPSVEVLALDLLSVTNVVEGSKCLINADSDMLMEYAASDCAQYSVRAVLGWKISTVKVEIDNLSFTMKKSKNTLKISCGLLGRHQVGPVACAAALAYELGLSKEQIEAAAKKIIPYKHRMQPRNVAGAWLIDDTYNGNLEGLIAGLNLLEELDAKRTWYVTPGLVDQGVETDHVHTKLGEHIAKTRPDIVVLMENSARPVIEAAMKKHGFDGELRVESDPLNFYTNIEHQIAVGDIVLMQNDWTDNYN